MHTLTVFEIYNLIAGTATAAGLLYLLYRTHRPSRYRRFVYPLVGGLVLFAVGGPAVDLFAPQFDHVVHGIAALLVVYGLYNPVANELRHEAWADPVMRDPSAIRHPRRWMTPMDETILELFHRSGLVLTPAIVASNTGYSREEVNRRLGELTDHGLVERVERGKYRITDVGEAYLLGEYPEATGGDPTTSVAH